MSAKFYPQDNFSVTVEVEGQKIGTFDHTEIAGIIEKVAGAFPGESELIINCNGFHACQPAVDKALEMAGLDGFQAAKQLATGKVVF